MCFSRQNENCLQCALSVICFGSNIVCLAACVCVFTSVRLSACLSVFMHASLRGRSVPVGVNKLLGTSAAGAAQIGAVNLLCSLRHREAQINQSQPTFAATENHLGRLTSGRSASPPLCCCCSSSHHVAGLLPYLVKPRHSLDDRHLVSCHLILPPAARPTSRRVIAALITASPRLDFHLAVS